LWSKAYFWVLAVAIRKKFYPYRESSKTDSRRGYDLVGNWTVRHHDAAAAPVGLQKIRLTGDLPGSNFPLVGTRLIGRSVAVRRVWDLLSANRAVTLTGPGGIGKTTLAVEVARRVLREFDDGGWLVELASLFDPALVPSAVAQVLQLGLGGGDISAEAVARAIGGQRLLLVLDNCEHVIDAAANLAETLLRLCPCATILATSREVLRIEGEHVYRVPPLDVPAHGQKEAAHILGHSAPELFIVRAAALGSDFSSHAESLPVIAAICRHLDGVPLAIEFAAAHAATLGVEQVALGLRDRLALLTSERRTKVPRHRTARAALDWSYDLLPEPERLLLRRLAVFPAGFTIDAATLVMSESGLDASAVLDGIANLVTKSLVTLDQSAVSTRWRLLETIRAYALEKLVKHGEAEHAARCHAAYFRDLFATSERGSAWRLSPEDLSAGLREIDNVRAALDWSFSRPGDMEIGADLTAAYGAVWMCLSLMAECGARCERALTDFEPDHQANAWRRLRLQALLGSALVATMGSAEQTKTVLTEVIEAAGRLGDLDTQAVALFRLAPMLNVRGEYGEARATAERLTLIAHQSRDQEIAAAADRLMGLLLLGAGRVREARICFERVLQSPVPLEGQQRFYWHYVDHRAVTRAMLARALCLLGFVDQALGEAEASLEELRGLTSQMTPMCRVIDVGISRVTLLTGDLAAAERAIERLIEAAIRSNSPFWKTTGRFLEGKLMVERGAFAEGVAALRGAFETASRTGSHPSYPEFLGALAEALAGLGQLSEALDAVNEAIASAGQHEGGQRWCVPELLRIKGEVLLQQGPDRSALAEGCYKQAAELAREQGALFWELRVALSLARLRVTQDCRDDARQILAPVYDRFTEGLETGDLRAARAILDPLLPA
jgi:predicted ATPase